MLHRRKRLDFHTNGMRFHALDDAGNTLCRREYYSVGGGFVLGEDETGGAAVVVDPTPVPYPFLTGGQLLAHVTATGLPISGIMLANEAVRRPEQDTRDGLLRIWQVMQDCVVRGCRTGGVLPGGLKVRRRAEALHQQLLAGGEPSPTRCGPWNGSPCGRSRSTRRTPPAAGSSPHRRTGPPGSSPPCCTTTPGSCPAPMTTGWSGSCSPPPRSAILFKENASISGAEVGCQGEVGSACAMAAAGLAEVLGGTPEQVENAAEIGIEHNLGLTCDPVGGLVQIPCIERNAVASVKAITAARMAVARRRATPRRRWTRRSRPCGRPAPT